jgi:diadenylate cyclase
MLVTLSIKDIIDIVLVAILLFQLYRLIKGTAAYSIFIAIFIIYLIWLIVKVLKMELLGALLGQVIGVGVIALIILFQQEIRRFLIVLGNRYQESSWFSPERFFPAAHGKTGSPRKAEEIVRAAESMASKNIGALIVIGRTSRLDLYSEAGELLKAVISAELLETIFFKNSPLHDGAVIIEDGRILAARCPLPITDQPNIPNHFGMRHRAAIGITENTDALAVVVSEESGHISVADTGKVMEDISTVELRKLLLKEKI